VRVLTSVLHHPPLINGIHTDSAITLAHLIAETRTIALPARIGVFTPAADASYTLSDYARAQTDVDVCPEQFLRVCAEQWLGRGPYIGAPGIGASQWRVDDPIVSASAIKHFPPDWPRTLIVCGDADVLIDGSRNVARRIEESGGYVRFIEVPEMVHGFHVFPFFSEQATAAWGRFMDFVRE
jgi:epsilon-lactone hydrolase